MNRRTFLTASALLSTATAANAFGLLWQRARAPFCGEREHPFLYVSADDTSGTRTVEELSAAIESGHARALWQSILEAARADLAAPVVMPDTPVPGRSPAAVATGNLDFYVCDAAGQRIKRQALVYLLTGDTAYRDAALQQLDAILDAARWPDWIDDAHVRFGHPAGLRTGMLANDAGLGYDWLYHGIETSDRRRIAQRLDARGIEPFRVSLEQDPWWMRDLNNWTTTIVGGVAVAAMAIEEEIADTAAIVELAQQTFERYLQIYGPEGEFNESPAYANATLRPVAFFRALDDWSGDAGSARLARHPFPETCTWLRYMTLPSGYTAAFGDSHVDAEPWTKHVAAIAAATGDPVLQQYYLAHARGGDAVELAWFDPSIGAASPSGVLPLGRHFPAHGGCFSIRESWDHDQPQMCVYGKTSREENHEHNDAGELCIDVAGERMIVDLGSPSGYPEDFFDEGRWQYYNASIIGHNVIQVGGREQRVPDWQRGDGRPQNISAITGHMVDREFSDDWGGRMLMDTTNAYEDVELVRRAVIVLRSGIVAVLDKVQLAAAAPVVLRWHTINRAAPDEDGSFVVRGERAALSCRVMAVAGMPSPRYARREHAYAAPYDRSRTGELLEARNESYVEVSATSDEVVWLSLFATVEPGAAMPRWTTIEPATLAQQRADSAGGASIERDGLIVSAFFDGVALRVLEGERESAQETV